MKTIEERAANLAKEFAVGKQNREAAVYRACIRMATEQRKADLEDTLKALCSTCRTMKNDGIGCDRDCEFMELFLEEMEAKKK